MPQESSEPHDLFSRMPKLAGLCSIQRASDANWSVDESVGRLKRIHYVLRRLHEALTSRITAEPIYELKTTFSHHAYLCAEHVTLIRARVGEMREPPLGLDKVPSDGLERLMDETQCAPTTYHFVIAVYERLIPTASEAIERLINDAHPLADAPTVRTAKLIRLELQEMSAVGREILDAFAAIEIHNAIDPQDVDANEAIGMDVEAWRDYLDSCVLAAGQIDGVQEPRELPARQFSQQAFTYQSEPRRDARFQDSFNAGVNPEAFLYDESFSPRDKTLMMYYKRFREIDVPEMMASILVELRDEEPWGFHMEMSRQLWDEARHAMMGEVGFATAGVDWTQIPVNFTWSRNLNLQLNARERHGVLFFIEQGLMPRTGKKYEWEVGLASGDALSGLFQDFDWADEVLHAQIGRRWYVPKFSSLNEAMDYGDECWSRVLSHWHQYKEDGLTDHRNWWPEIYEKACQHWGVEPDAHALAFCETYEDSRADLKKL